MKHYIFSIISALLIALFLAFVPELAARLVYRVRLGEWPISLHRAVETAKAESNSLFLEHSILPFVLRPGTKQRFMETYVEVNAAGFRGPELRTTPLRILAVGGSTTFDPGVSNNCKTWTAALETNLDHVMPGVEVVNGGVPVYSIWTNYIKYILYDHDLRPDVVLIYQGVNDTVPWVRKAYFDAFLTDYWLYRGLASRLWSGLQGANRPIESQVVGWTARSVLLWGAYNKRGRNENLYAQLIRGQSADECMPDRVLLKNVDMLRHFTHSIQSDGSIPIFAPQSVGASDRTNVAGENFKAVTGGLEKLNNAYIRQCQESGVKVVDLTKIMRRWGDEYFQDTLHFSERGSQALGKLLAESLAKDQDLRRIYAANCAHLREMPVRVR